MVLGMDPIRWANRFSIEPFSHPCDSCGRLLTTTIPIVFETLRGLQAPRCECGNEHTPFCFVRDPRVGDLFTDEVAPNSKMRAVRRTLRRARRPVLRLCSLDG